MRNKSLLLALLCVSVLFTNCNIFKSKEKRAEYHLKKAQSLNPDIMQRFKLDTSIDVNIDYEGNVIDSGDTINYKFNCDSLMKLLKSKNDSIYQYTLLNDSLNHIILTIDKNGNVKVDNIRKPKLIPYKGKVKTKIRVIVHPYTYPVYVDKSFYQITWFWISLLLLLILILILSRK